MPNRPTLGHHKVSQPRCEVSSSTNRRKTNIKTGTRDRLILGLRRIQPLYTRVLKGMRRLSESKVGRDAKTLKLQKTHTVEKRIDNKII